MEDNIKMHLREVGWGAWTESIWLRIETGSCECGDLLGSIKCGEFLSSSGRYSFSGRTLLHGVSNSEEATSSAGEVITKNLHQWILESDFDI